MSSARLPRPRKGDSTSPFAPRTRAQVRNARVKITGSLLIIMLTIMVLVVRLVD